jgi:REP element-mobilizing transposase RayT
MINHIHIIVSSSDVSGFIRDFKTFTSNELKKNILITEPSLVKLFSENGSNFKLWELTNIPVNIISTRFFLQKQNYIHLNPVRRSYVRLPEHWYWSSANEYCELKTDSYEF